MVIEGLPLFFLEMGIGQRFRKCAILSWKEIHPVFFGLGVGMLMVSIMLCLYYVVVIAWCCYYFFISFTSQLPWQRQLLCKNWEPYSYLKDQLDACTKNTTHCYNTTRYYMLKNNVSNFPDCCVRDAPQYYFYHHTLQISPAIDDLGIGINGKLAGCLVFAWVITYLCIVKGIKSSGKVTHTVSIC